MLRFGDGLKKAALGLIVILGALAVTSALLELRPLPAEPIYFVPGRPFQAALTFETRWSSKGLTRLLQILKDEGITATFFLTGAWIEEHPAEAARILKQGHEIGNHTLSHTPLLYLSEKEIKEELDGFNETAHNILEYRPRLFRPPRGLYNGVVLEAARRRRCQTVLWSIDSRDYLIKDPALLERRIESRLHHGAIIVFRVGAPSLPEALPGILAHIREAGYRPVTVTELLKNESRATDR